MAEKQRSRDLDLREDLGLQRRIWIVERIAWVLMGGVLVFALFGGFGDGLLSDARARAPGGTFELAYERLTRHEVPTRLTFRLAPEELAGGRARLWLSNAYLRHHRIASVEPSLESVEAAAERTYFTFRVADASRPIVLAFHVLPQGYWRHEGRAGTRRRALDFATFVLP